MRVFRALTAEPWAIEPSWLPLLSALAQRNHSAPEIEAAKDWQKRDYALMAGPGAQRLAGAQRAFLNEGVAIIPVTGPIFPRANMMTEMSGATSVTMLQNDYRAALNASEVGAIMLVIDSPGGAVSGIEATSAMISAGAKKKQTVAHVVGNAASAAYWIGTQAGEMFIDRTAMVGSIGVVAAIPKQVVPDGDGVIDIEIVSSNAPNKRPDPETDSGAEQIRAMLDSIEAEFIADVARGRKVSVAKVKSDFGQGGMTMGASAVALGMADRVQSQDATFSALRRAVANERKLQSLKN